MQKTKGQQVIEIVNRLSELKNWQYNYVKRECLLQRPHLTELFTLAEQIRTSKKTV